MRADVEEQMAVLRRGVFGAVGRGEAHCQHHWLSVILLLGLAEKGDRVVGDEVGIVVFGVVEAVFLQKGAVQIWFADKACNSQFSGRSC